MSERPRTTVSVGALHPGLTRGGICVPPTVTYLPVGLPRFRLNTYGRRSFSVAGPMAWNSLPDFIRDPTSSTDCLKRTCSRDTSSSSALGVLNDYALYKSTHSLTKKCELDKYSERVQYPNFSSATLRSTTVYFFTEFRRLLATMLSLALVIGWSLVVLNDKISDCSWPCGSSPWSGP